MFAVRATIAVVFNALFTAAAIAQVAPPPPQNLTHFVAGTTVTLAWTPPAAGPVTSYLVEASVVPGGAIVASLPVGGTTLTVPNVPPGVYFVHVRALNGASASAPSNVVAVSVTGGTGCPAPPLPPQLVVRATGLAVTLSWLSPGGCAPTSYVVLAGSAAGLADIAQVNVGGQTGLSAVAPTGTYYIRVVGTNAFGSATSDELTARVAVNNVTDTIQPFNFLFFDVTLTQTGTYQASLVWNDASLDLDLYLTTPNCPYPPTGCALAISDRAGVNSEVVSLPVNVGETYRLYVDNFSNRATAFTITNVVFPGASSPPQ